MGGAGAERRGAVKSKLGQACDDALKLQHPGGRWRVSSRTGSASHMLGLLSHVTLGPRLQF